MAKAGIQMPETFDLKGIFTLVMQVLGLAYDSIKSRTIKALGKNEEKIFNGLEKTFEIFVILKNEGLAGLWQFIQDKVGDLKAMVIDTIQNFVIESVIKQGVLWVISLLNPASAFAKACKMIYDVIMFFIERGSQIVDLVNAVMESVTAIANGALGGAAKLIEYALSKTTEMGGERGYDAGNKVTGRKRHIVVDTLGLLLLVVMYSAAMQDRDGACTVFQRWSERVTRRHLIWADGGYAGALVDLVRASWRWTLAIVKRTDDMRGFVVLPRRWVVERTFA